MDRSIIRSNLRIIKRLYQIGIWAYGLALGLAAPFHTKAGQWVAGRKDWHRVLRQQLSDKKGPWIWFHCASLGEFEQGRNLLERIKGDHPEYQILLTFFSPSGYEIRKHYQHADLVCYLPLDTARNAERFVSLFDLKLVFFIKYELWLNYLEALAKRDIPTLLVSARFDAQSKFVRSPMQGLYQQAFQSLAHIFTQDQGTKDALARIGISQNVSVSGDTRFDRVSSNASEWKPIEEIAAFKKERLCIVAGSSWPKGEDMLLEFFDRCAERFDLCMILAPHEINQNRIEEHMRSRAAISLKHSNIAQLNDQHRILWIDNIGMLSKLYAYADVAYVGGGWGTGLHNILEAVVFGCPVLFGPEHHKFPEAQALIEAGGGFAVANLEAMQDCLASLLDKDQLRLEVSRKNKSFVAEQAGATEQIIHWCRSEGLLPQQ
ncbi:MAG: glycosyltransferase N-terminal domain-containing protein [Bacteroidota bacterium]